MTTAAQREEYLRRNLVHAKAVGAEAGLDRTLDRLRKTKGTPKWLLRDLEAVRQRVDVLPQHLAAYRDDAVR